MIGVNGSVLELIQRRRLQLLVHSCIYYEYNESLSDEQWKDWAIELETLQKEFTQESERAPWYEVFKGFDHSTGYHLPTKDPWVMGTARWLLRIADKYKT